MSSTPENIIVGDFNLPFLELEKKDLIRKSICLYGESESGKSKLLQHILTKLTDIDICICFNPGEESNQTFTGYIPKAAIHKTLDESTIKKIFDRQDILSSTYIASKNIDNLKSLVNKLGYVKELDKIKQINSFRDKVIGKIKSKYSTSEQNGKITEINELCNKVLIGAYKKAIGKNKELIKPIYKSLSQGEKICAKYYNMKEPHILLCFDDIASILKPFKKNEYFLKLFKEGRHKYITSIWLCQSVLDLHTEWRRSVFINIFAGETSIIPFFNDSGNGYTAKMKKQVQSLVESVYQVGVDFDTTPKKYYKIVHIRNDPRGKTLYYTRAQLHEPFKFGSKVYQNYLNKIEKRDENLDKNNTFYNYIKT